MRDIQGVIAIGFAEVLIFKIYSYAMLFHTKDLRQSLQSIINEKMLISLHPLILNSATLIFCWFVFYYVQDLCAYLGGGL